MNRLRRRTVAVAALAVLAVSRAHAQEVQVLVLRYRQAEDVIPMLRPYLDPAAKLTGQGDRLFVHTTPQNLAQIRQLLAKLDRAPRWLTIAVRRDRPPVAAAEARVPNSGTNLDSRAATAPASSAGTARITRTQAGEQAIRMLEDTRAPIQFETAVPMSFRHYAIGAQGVEEIRGTVTYDTVVQFVVRPRLTGTAVTLEIEPQDGAVLTDAGERGRLSTTVRGRLGDWIAVGGADLRDGIDARAGADNLRAQTRLATNQRGVWLKVELEPEPVR